MTRLRCPRWIRTTILGSKVRCPAVGRGGRENQKLADTFDRNTSRRIARPDHARIVAERECGWRIEHTEYGRARTGQLGERRRAPHPIEHAADRRISLDDGRLEIIAHDDP